MRLSWNEVRVRAAAFAGAWHDATDESRETHSFYNDFFQVFDVDRRSVARYEEHVTKLDDKDGYIDLFWPGVLLVEQKSAGRSLVGAYDQAGEYFDALKMRDRPRYILVSDFQNFELHDLDERKTVAFPLRDLPNNVEAFGFIMGVQQRTFRDQDPANIKAAELVGRLHDELHRTGYQGHDLERFLVRIVFCLFADDTGIFDPRDIFFDFLEDRTRRDGSDLGPWLSQLFQVLNTPVENRVNSLDADLARFPYLNGDLFRRFDEYWNDVRFAGKRPDRSGSPEERCGDNIYHRDPETAKWIQAEGFHSRTDGTPHEKHILRDTNPPRVLIGRVFAYFGATAVEIPDSFRSWESRDYFGSVRGHRCKFPVDLQNDFIAWLQARSADAGGLAGEPLDWATSQPTARDTHRHPGRRGAARGCRTVSQPPVMDPVVDECG